MSLTLIVLGSYIAGALSVIAGVWCAVGLNERRTDVPVIEAAWWVSTDTDANDPYAVRHPDAQRSEATN